MTRELDEEMNKMCNLSEGVKEEFVEIIREEMNVKKA